MPETIYSTRNAFFLEIDSIDYRIIEPVLWNKTEFAIERDLERHGVDINFPNKDSVLEFSNNPEPNTGNKSKQLIDNKYDLDGPDSEILLKFGTLDANDVFTEISRQRLDFGKQYSNELHVTKCATSYISKKQRIKDYMDAKIRVGYPVDILGEQDPVLGSYPVVPISFHTQSIINEIDVIGGRNLLEGVDFTQDWSGPEFFVQYSTQIKNAFSGLEDFQLPTGASDIDPTTIPLANFGMENAGKLTIKEVEVQPNIIINQQPSLSDITVTSYFAVGRAGKFRQFQIGQTVHVNVPPGVQSIGGSVTLPGVPFDVPYMREGDFILIYTHVESDEPGNDLQIQQLNVGLNICKFEVHTIAEVKEVECYRLETLARYMCDSLSGKVNSLQINNFFDPSGPGYDFHATSGYWIRQIGIENKSNNPEKRPSLSMDELLDSMNMHFALGFNVEIVNGDVELVLEEVEYFYQNHEIIDLSTRTSNFSKEINKELSINVVSFDHPQPSVRETKGEGSIDAVNTQIEANLPITTATKKVNKKTVFRTEGYDIETSRRVSELDKDSVKTDESPFLVNTISSTSQIIRDIDFLEDPNRLRFPATAYDFIRRYSKIDITGTASNNKEFTYNIETQDWVFGNSEFTIEVNESVTAETANNATITVDYERSKQNEDFDKNVFTETDDQVFPEVEVEVRVKDDIYNMILLPQRAMIQHSKWLNAAAWYKDPTKLYRTLKYLNADNLKTQLKVSATHKYGDLNTVELIAKTHVAIQDSYQGKSIVTPNLLKFSADMMLDEVNTIKDAMNGQGPTPYGYITTVDNDGNPVQGYLLELSGNPNENPYDIVLMEKGDFYD